MTAPAPYDPTTSFTGSSPYRDAALGAAMDVEFNNIAAVVSAIEDSLSLIQRSDGEVQNQSIGLDQLATDVLAALSGGLSGPLPPLSFFQLDGNTVADLPASASEGTISFATDGLKVDEATGFGTGVPVYWSDGAWRVFSTDQPVQS
jgi:hypothetical protein